MTNTAGEPIKSLATCMYCQLDTAGNHKSNCPARDVNPIVNTSTNTISPMTEEEGETIEPVGKFILDNAKGIQCFNGVYYHYADVCSLLKKYLAQPKTEPSRTCDTQGDFIEEFAKSQKSESKEESGIIHEILSECPKTRTNETITSKQRTKEETLRMLCDYYRFIHKEPGRNWGLAEEAEAFLKTYQSQPNPQGVKIKRKSSKVPITHPNI